MDFNDQWNYAKAVRAIIEQIDPEAFAGWAIVNTAWKEGLSQIEAAERCLEHELTMEELTPLKGQTDSFHAEVSKLQRPYIRIPEDRYKALVDADAGYYRTPAGGVVTFGTADNGFALMPLKEEAAQQVLAYQ